MTNITNACDTLRFNRRRYYRWLNQKNPLPRTAWNKITPKEEQAILESSRDERLCDLRSAGLMVYGHDSGKFHCSISTVQRILARNNLQVPYTVPKRRRPAKPDIRSLMDGPRKVFSYDWNRLLSYQLLKGRSNTNTGSGL